MIVCHCNVILRDEIRRAARRILAADPSGSLEPQSIYRELQKKGRCCSCFPTVAALVTELLGEALHEVDNAGLSAASPAARVMSKG